MTTHTLIASEPTVRSTVGYLVQYGYVGGQVGNPVAYWQDDHLSFTTADEAFARLHELRARYASEPSRHHTGDIRVVQKTTTTTFHPILQSQEA